MPKLTLLVGPPGSGKSTLAKLIAENSGDLETAPVYVNQDSQGRDGHMDMFLDAVYNGKNVIVDRMNFNKQQRRPYVEIAKLKGYSVHVIIKCESQATCLARMLVRKGHETIKDERAARSAMQTFFTKYEPPEQSEGIDSIERIYPDVDRPLTIYSDLDGTLCDVEHRRHFVRPPSAIIGKIIEPTAIADAPVPFKKNWKAFFAGIADDPVNTPVMEVLRKFCPNHQIVYCTGRDENYRAVTEEWLKNNMAPAGDLYMRHRNDSRADYIVKEILLDFEVLSRYDILFCLDDRDQVVEMLRRRGLTVFQVANGDF